MSTLDISEWIKTINLGLEDNYVACALTLENIEEIADISSKLWANHLKNEMYQYAKDTIDLGSEAVFFGMRDMDNNGLLVGFAQCQIHKNGEPNIDDKDIGYLEGIYIEPDYRFLNLASALMELCDEWTKYKGCEYIGSDCYIENEASYNLHLKNGYEDIGKDIAREIYLFKKHV